MLEPRSKRTANTSQTRGLSANPQSGRLLLALILLLVALTGVVLKDRQFWFGTAPSALDSDPSAATVAAKTATTAASASTTHAKSVAVPTKKRIAAAPSSPAPQPTDAPAVTATRTVLPPLDVEVVAGDKHSTIHPGSNATKVEITRPGTLASSALASAKNAAQREPISADAQPSYPLLAQHMNVQGSVVLQAVIGADGIIQNIKVVTGPAILALAAQQAIREWHFKPVLQNGQAVETQAKITVNFNIKVADGSSNPTIAENESDRIQVLSR